MLICIAVVIIGILTWTLCNQPKNDYTRFGEDISGKCKCGSNNIFIVKTIDNNIEYACRKCGKINIVANTI